MTTVKSPKYIFAIGRRKSAVSRIRLFKGKGETLVNNLPIDKYFPGAVLKKLYQEPLVTCDVLDKYYVTVKVLGSGKMSQLTAVIHGLARALVKANPDFRPPLRQKGFITRDPRERQRRMIGMGGKSRRKKQSPKR
ncbi:MAG: 30S ribosomal protein S9 [Candidatus Beckwithbacteria bacterium]|nr:30S ribosomal protein S9 [Candidatus Beckwithbacteria bacterium]